MEHKRIQRYLPQAAFLSDEKKSSDAIKKAIHNGIKAIPAIAVNGVLLSSSQNKGISETELVNAGVGNQIGLNN